MSNLFLHVSIFSQIRQLWPWKEEGPDAQWMAGGSVGRFLTWDAPGRASPSLSKEKPNQKDGPSSACNFASELAR